MTIHITVAAILIILAMSVGVCVGWCMDRDSDL